MKIRSYIYTGTSIYVFQGFCLNITLILYKMRYPRLNSSVSILLCMHVAGQWAAAAGEVGGRGGRGGRGGGGEGGGGGGGGQDTGALKCSGGAKITADVSGIHL